MTIVVRVAGRYWIPATIAVVAAVVAYRLARRPHQTPSLAGGGGDLSDMCGRCFSIQSVANMRELETTDTHTVDGMAAGITVSCLVCSDEIGCARRQQTRTVAAMC
jgi:hypothetical protein